MSVADTVLADNPSRRCAARLTLASWRRLSMVTTACWSAPKTVCRRAFSKLSCWRKAKSMADERSCASMSGANVCSTCGWGGCDHASVICSRVPCRDCVQACEAGADKAKRKATGNTCDSCSGSDSKRGAGSAWAGKGMPCAIKPRGAIASTNAVSWLGDSSHSTTAAALLFSRTESRACMMRSFIRTPPAQRG